MNIRKLFVTAFVAVAMLGGEMVAMDDPVAQPDESIGVDEESMGLAADRQQEIKNNFEDSVLRNRLFCDAARSEEMNGLTGWYESVREMNDHFQKCFHCKRNLESLYFLENDLKVWKECVGENENIKALKKRLKHRDAHVKARLELRRFLTTEEEYMFAFEQALDRDDSIAMIAIANARAEANQDDEGGERIFAIARHEFDLLSGFLKEVGIENFQERALSIYQAAARGGFAHAELVEIIKSDSMVSAEKSKCLEELVNKTNYPEALYYFGKSDYCPNQNYGVGELLKRYSGIAERREPGRNGEQAFSKPFLGASPFNIPVLSKQ